MKPDAPFPVTILEYLYRAPWQWVATVWSVSEIKVETSNRKRTPRSNASQSGGVAATETHSDVDPNGVARDEGMLAVLSEIDADFYGVHCFGVLWIKNLMSHTIILPGGRAAAHRGLGREAAGQERSAGRADGRARRFKKKSWGELRGAWVPHDTRDAVVDWIGRWSERSEIARRRLIGWLGVASSKFYDWQARYGKVNEHNGWIQRDDWLEEWEKQAIIAYHKSHPLEGYRRLTFTMLDANIVAISPESRWRVLHAAGLLSKWKAKPTSKGKGFQGPSRPHQHWHMDVSYVNLSGTFYYLCSVLDGYSRYLVHWELRESVTEAEVEIVLAPSSWSMALSGLLNVVLIASRPRLPISR